MKIQLRINTMPGELLFQDKASKTGVWLMDEGKDEGQILKMPACLVRCEVGLEEQSAPYKQGKIWSGELI